MNETKIRLRNKKTLVVDFESSDRKMRLDDRAHFLGYVFVVSPDTQEKLDKACTHATRRLGYNEAYAPLAYFEE